MISSTDAARDIWTERFRHAWQPSYVVVEGDHTAGYSWHENEDEMEVTFRLPHGTTKSDVACDIRPASIRLLIKSFPTILDGALAGRVHTEASGWLFEPTATPNHFASIVITLAKRERSLWGYVMLSDRVRADDRLSSPLKSGPSDVSKEPVASTLQNPGVDWLAG